MKLSCYKIKQINDQLDLLQNCIDIRSLNIFSLVQGKNEMGQSPLYMTNLNAGGIYNISYQMVYI